MAGLYEAPSLSTIKVGQFRGSDSSAPEDQIKPYRAERSENMIPGAAGEVCKRPGVQYEKELPVSSFVHGDEETVAEVIGGKHIITERKETFFITAKDVIETVVYRLYYAYDGGYKYVFGAAGNKPVSIRYGEEYVVFAANCREIRKNAIYVDDGVGSNINKGGVIVFLGAGALTAYTSEGLKTTLQFDTDLWATEEISPDDDRLTVPVILIGCDPSGGGTPYQKVNLLNPWVTESFCCKKEYTSVFYLQAPASDITDYGVLWTDQQLAGQFKVEVLITVSEGEGEDKQDVLRWVERDFGSKDRYRPAANRIYLSPENNSNGHYTDPETGNRIGGVNVGTGLDSWIGASPMEGEDNIRITHKRPEFEEAFIKLCCCVCGTTFGVGGYKDRLFIGGGEHQNRVYYSELENPFYIGDLNYIETEQGSAVMALDGAGDSLAILTDRGIYLSKAAAQDSAESVTQVADAVFTVSSRIHSPAPINFGNTAVLGGEIVYLSESGVIAVSYKENFAERFAEHRSAMIDRDMMRDQPVQLISIGRFLMIRCRNGVWWLLDENQPNKEGDQPYSSHQYEGFRMTGMYADAAWADGDELKLAYGRIQCRWTDGTVPEHYHDQYGKDQTAETPISAWWETPYIYGSNFYRKKIFMKLGLLLGQLESADTAVKVEGKKNEEEWKELWSYDGALCSFDYGRIDYRLFTYAPNPGCPDISRKIKIKKAQRFKLRFTNDLIDQPFILREFGLDYVQED